MIIDLLISLSLTQLELLLDERSDVFTTSYTRDCRRSNLEVPSKEGVIEEHSTNETWTLQFHRLSQAISERSKEKSVLKNAQQILRCNIRESKLNLCRHPRVLNQSTADQISSDITLTLGDVDAHIPMHVESMHEASGNNGGKCRWRIYTTSFQMVLRRGPQINEEFNRILQQQQVSV